MKQIATAAEARRLLTLWQDRGEWADLLPEVLALQDVPQPPEYHGEGDVLSHTLLALDVVDDDDDERVFWAVLFHDLGKATMTRFEGGRWRARGHAEFGAAIALSVMHRLGRGDIASDVAWLVSHHHFYFGWGKIRGSRLSKRQLLFCRQPLFPLLIRVAEADAAGSIGISRKGRMLERIRNLAEAALGEL
ncbi:metal-dependent phosphohydrolase, putative [Syntrophotalea carbinolica DSM 2380]|uniref:Metal-dependent phosphohydrolase, putative n=1 Tax=Syntrophotalea carbinolica (strain DSM 2380 / NBRC 103641 / GraBd1) TaxID=338963 RepID=Q3A4J2_SYNC1|nr:HD domain-containing protein [Syntrophotalea carbinolica]ABA88715.1 metal-dependent phosphohydrolase, putative [Syntrophotalea carbinolica DSM 2380]